ncbi:MAG: hypothetical protein ACKO39_02745, partial [Chthoniobacterales bacterium]
MNGMLRRFLRLIAFALFLPVTLPAYLVFLGRGRLKGVPPNVLWLQWLLRYSLRIMGGRLRVVGEPPRSGLIV